MNKNPSLWVGLAIPVLMIVFIAAAIYLPRIFGEPLGYDFVYMSFDYSWPHSPSYNYRVRNGALTRIPVPVVPGTKPVETPIDPQLYIYDAETNTSHEISFEEAEKFKLDPNYESPDGFRVKQDDYRGDFLFFFGEGQYEPGIYLEGGGVSREINVNSVTDRYNYRSFELLGWVIPQ